MSKKEETIVCRVCLRSDLNNQKCISLFDEYRDSLIFDIINSIANIGIKKNDGLPSKICPDCLLELGTALNFKQKCETSNAILHSVDRTYNVLGADITKLDVYETVAHINLNLIKKEEPEDIDFDFERDTVTLDVCEFEKEESSPEYSRNEEKPFKSKAIDLKLLCNECGGSFKSKCKLRVHWKKVHLREALICPICKRTFTTYKAMHRHIKNKSQACIGTQKMRIEGVGRSRMFHCPECDYKSHRVKDTKAHLVVHSGERPFECKLCPKAFTQQSGLDCHIEGVHKMYKLETTCQYCGKYLKGRAHATKHIRRHKSVSAQCDICKKMFNSKKGLQVHMQRHSGFKAYTCEMCASSFYTLSELANHRRFTHKRLSHWFKCDMCGYKVHRKEHLTKHKLKHTDTNVPCTVCGRFYENAVQLAQHQKCHFDKKYSCPHCESKYHCKKTLSKHMCKVHRCKMIKPVNVKKENVSDEIIEISPISVI